jgi:hypothetical protein
MRIMSSDQCMGNKRNRPRRKAGPVFVIQRNPQVPGVSTALAGALARVLLAAGVNTALKAAFLAMASRESHALGCGGTWRGTTLGFGNDFVGHDWLRYKVILMTCDVQMRANRCRWPGRAVSVDEASLQ